MLFPKCKNKTKTCSSWPWVNQLVFVTLSLWKLSIPDFGINVVSWYNQCSFFSACEISCSILTEHYNFGHLYRFWPIRKFQFDLSETRYFEIVRLPTMVWINKVKQKLSWSTIWNFLLKQYKTTTSTVLNKTQPCEVSNMHIISFE